MTVDEMIEDVDTCRRTLARVESELKQLLGCSDVTIKSTLFGAATQAKSTVHMTTVLLESLEVYRDIAEQLGDSRWVRTDQAP